MTQFDVHRNPIPAARRAYPYVVVLQSTLADAGRARIVAPLVPRRALGDLAGRLTPSVSINDAEYVVLVPSLTAIPAQALDAPVGSAQEQRPALLAAIDRLFFGV